MEMVEEEEWLVSGSNAKQRRSCVTRGGGRWHQHRNPGPRTECLHDDDSPLFAAPHEANGNTAICWRGIFLGPASGLGRVGSSLTCPTYMDGWVSCKPRFFQSLERECGLGNPMPGLEQDNKLAQFPRNAFSILGPFCIEEIQQINDTAFYNRNWPVKQFFLADRSPCSM